jgi:hypothetical protein
MTTKIVELFIEDMEDESGIEAISLVSRPAHDETWLAFNHEEEVEKLEPQYKVMPDDFCTHNPLLNELGEHYRDLIDEGWEVVRVEKMTPQIVHKMNQERFTKSNPNAESELDKEKFRVRFKYVGPVDDRNRRFCADMMSANRVYRIEDIDALSDGVANPEFGFYEIFTWRGSFNCRHQWVRLIYKKTGSIINSGDSTKGLTREEGLGPGIQRDTRNDVTKRVGETGTLANGNPASPLQVSRDRDPRAGSKFSEEEIFVDSINDYPQGVKDAASKAVKYAEENGWGSCGTGVGKQRASQLSKGENISVDTIERMYSYLSRHKVDLETSKSYEDGCGKLMYDAWGGEAGLAWSERKLKQLVNEEMSKNQKLLFYDEDKRILVGAAMVPNKMIIRYDALGNPYHVFFSKKTIKKMADKFLRQRRTDETSIEHNGIKLGADKVYITESWVSEDPIKDKSAAYGFNLPSGTWYVTMKIEDPKVWKLIKDKMLTGFSVEGLFAEKSVFSKDAEIINTIKDILKSIKDE